MRKPLTQIQRFKKGSDYCSLYRTGVSLHSHTMHSKESLRRLPLYIDKFPIGGYVLERELGRLHLYHGWHFNFTKYYWTPPLSPREAYELESNAIEQSIGLNPLVSLSDHDNIKAGHLRLLAATQDVPISVEWTAPFEGIILHLGVHRLPAPEAANWIAVFQEYTKNPRTAQFAQLLIELNASPSVLIVLNHPYWSAENIAPEVHLRFFEARPLEIREPNSRRGNERDETAAREPGSSGAGRSDWAAGGFWRRPARLRAKRNGEPYAGRDV